MISLDRAVAVIDRPSTYYGGFMEIWKDIACYEGWYQVSNLGNVKSLKRDLTRSDGVKQTYQEKILKNTISTTGYHYVSLTKNSNVKKFKTHRLVANAFLDRDKEKKYVNHIDHNPLNNRLENLEWCTNQENICFQKRRKNNAYGYKGLSLSKNGFYRVRIQYKYKQYEIGKFKDIKEAARAYNTHAEKMFGKFSLLNEVN